MPGGTILLSYTELKLRGMEVTFCFSDDTGATWSETSFLLKGDLHASSCLIATDGLVGAIVATDTSIIWVGLDAQGGLAKTMISLEGVAGNFASHFSATTYEAAVYLGVATTDHKLAFFTYDPMTEDWSKSASPIDPAIDVRWIQTSVAEDGAIYLIYDDGAQGQIGVLQSTDNGESWVTKAELDLPFYLRDDAFHFDVSEQTVGDMEIMVELDAGLSANALYSFVGDVDDNGFGQEAVAAPVEVTEDYFVF